MDLEVKLPPERIPYRKKTKDWRRRHIDWASNYIWVYDTKVRKSLKNKLINYNLIAGHLDMADLKMILNPDNLEASYIPDDIQHYPIINGKLNLLAGEEIKRRFDFRVVITNPDQVSDIETIRRDKYVGDLQSMIEQNAQSEEELQNELQKLDKYIKYEWQDIREIRGSAVLNHYAKELDFPLLFNKGYYNAMSVGEELYQCDIEGGEPVLKVLNPAQVIILKNGYNSNFENADMVIMWDYWSLGKIVDTYYDILTKDDIDYLESLPFTSTSENTDIEDPRRQFLPMFDDWALDRNVMNSMYFDSKMFGYESILNAAPTDMYGNIRVLKLYWKSLRKILKVKSYHPDTGEEEYNFYPENYVVNEAQGEEYDVLWINEAWEATKIGMDRYVNMRPRVVQYNRLTNPSRCHFGIIGSSYNINNSKPLSLVDLAKPYNYLYDVIHDRLNRNLAASWGVKAAMDFSLIPDKWDIDKWLYFTKTTPFYPKDSFKEGNKGAATGKLAGMMNSSATTLNLDQSAIISQDIQLLNFIKAEMGEVMGITPQREGAISSSETVGGVERSVIQSNSITEWLFTLHDNIKKRVCECFLETAKVAFRGRSIKLPYILHSGYQQMLEFDGDEFAECDYGLVVDNTNDVQSFLQKLEMYAHALIQNKQITTGTLAKIWNKASINDIVRSIEYDERKTEESNLQSMRMQQEQFKAELERKAVMDERLMQLEELKLQDNREANIRDNETRKEIADKQVELKRDLQALIESDKTDFEVDQLIRQRLKL